MASGRRALRVLESAAAGTGAGGGAKGRWPGGVESAVETTLGGGSCGAAGRTRELTGARAQPSTAQPRLSVQQSR